MQHKIVVIGTWHDVSQISRPFAPSFRPCLRRATAGIQKMI
jgi:hypothetical protein